MMGIPRLVRRSYKFLNKFIFPTIYKTLVPLDSGVLCFCLGTLQEITNRRIRKGPEKCNEPTYWDFRQVLHLEAGNSRLAIISIQKNKIGHN